MTLDRAGLTTVTHHSQWLDRSEVRAGFGAAREHKNVLEVLRLALQFDQVNPGALACLEYVTRRLVQLETAVRRSPHNPGYTNLEHMLTTTVDTSGAAQTEKFTKWSSDRLPQESQGK